MFKSSHLRTHRQCAKYTDNAEITSSSARVVDVAVVVVGDVTSVLHNDQDWMMRLFAVLKNIRVTFWQRHMKISITVPDQQFGNY